MTTTKRSRSTRGSRRRGDAGSTAGRIRPTLLPGSDGDEDVRGPRNAERFLFYWRLDLSAERRFEVGATTLEPCLNIVNVFNRKNVFLYTIDSNTDPPLVKTSAATADVQGGDLVLTDTRTGERVTYHRR